MTIEYGEVDALRRLASELDATIEQEEYGASVRYHLAVPTPDVARFEEAVSELSQGRALVEDG